MTHTPLADLYGLVLSGGRSQRMQQDKAALDYAGQPQLQRACTLLGSVCQQVFVSVRTDQTDDTLRSRWPLIVDAQGVDAESGLGPLAGILAAQAAHPQAAWLVVACDLPRLNLTTLQQLVEARDGIHEAIAFQLPDDSHPEPLCTIWEPGSSAQLRDSFAQQMFSPRRLLHTLHTLRLTPHHPGALSNINTPDEYHRTLAHMSTMPSITTLAITAQYFAVFREQAGTRSESLNTTAKTASELYQQLQQQHGFRLRPEQLKVAINNEFRDWHTELRNGDTVTFIPPVAGG